MQRETIPGIDYGKGLFLGDCCKMYNEKIENLLNLSLHATMEERNQSEVLEVGYEPTTKKWELIVKYHGTLPESVNGRIQVEYLLCGYAIVTLPEAMIEELASYEEVEYIEKPKRLYFQNENARIQSGIPPITFSPLALTGEGVIVAIIDSGIAYTHPDLRYENGSTRILSIWDQSIMPTDENGFQHPEGYLVGSEFTREAINEALLQDNTAKVRKLVPTVDVSGHGTAIALLASGNGSINESLVGVAPKSELLVVKLGSPSTSDFPQTTQLLRALSYVITYAVDAKKPLVINLSFGNTYGAHDGSSLLERYIDSISAIGRTSICVGSGNEASSGGHVSGILEKGMNLKRELAIAPYTTSLNIQVWLHYVDTIEIELTSPSGVKYLIPIDQVEILRTTLEDVELLIYVGMPTPYSVRLEVFIDLIAKGEYLTEGIWSVELIPLAIVNGRYDMYLPSLGARNVTTRFYEISPEKTLTIPSTAKRVITVGAYNSTLDAYAYFSGRGAVELDERGIPLVYSHKPDLVAPGVDLMIPSVQPNNVVYSGTSYATPFVTGGCALLMEWGIVKGNDPYLYGEKMKACLQKGASPLRGFTSYPNAQVGYGKLNLFNTFENIRRL